LPLNASFIIKELKVNAKDEKSPVIIVLLDAKSAFDVVDPYYLLRRLYQTVISDKLWSLINSLHQGATSVVKRMGHESSVFKVTQGVRQGGILCADLYKMYVNLLLDRLNHTGI
jgi:flagellar assembly factor FliW